MQSLRRRRVLLGISAGVAAYKAAELARGLVKAGAEVQVVMTPAASAFIGKLTLQAITGQGVRDQLFDEQHEAAMGHIELARWADAVVIAPATADLMARLACGLANDLLTTVCLATPAPLWLAPAMNQQMWQHPATQANLARLRERGVRILGPASGEQACGDTGPGRMLEPDEILAELTGTGRASKLRAVVTAGPTREAVDPVRFIGNRSTGKMGFAIADELARAGADVVLVSGPVALATPAGVERVDVESAQQMSDAVHAAIADADLFVACAAVADYRPRDAAAEKIKKTAGTLTLELVRNPDILASVSALPQRPFCVGFAAETQQLEENAEAKRRAKGLDMVAANLVGPGLGFDVDNNALHVLWDGGQKKLSDKPKTQLASELVALMLEHLDAQTATQDT